MRNIESKWLEDFLTLVELRNFSQAAEARNLSQPAFSRRIRSLEYAVGVELFDRTAIPLQLTPHGRLFHAQARNLLSQIESNLNELSGVDTTGKAYIRIAAAHSLALAIIPPMLQNLNNNIKHFLPWVEAIDVDQAREALLEGQSDFILSFHEEELWQKPFLHRKWCETEMIPVAATDETGHPRFTLTDAEIPLLAYTPGSYFGRLVNRKIAQLPALPICNVFISSMADLLKRMVLENHGIAWLPEISIRQELAAQQLIRLDLPNSGVGCVIPLEICLYRSETRLNATAEAFWGAVAAE